MKLRGVEPNADESLRVSACYIGEERWERDEEIGGDRPLLLLSRSLSIHTRRGKVRDRGSEQEQIVVHRQGEQSAPSLMG